MTGQTGEATTGGDSAATGQAARAGATAPQADSTDTSGNSTGTSDSSGSTGAAAAGRAAERVTVGKAAQVIEFHTRLQPVADPDELGQAVRHLREQAARLVNRQTA